MSFLFHPQIGNFHHSSSVILSSFTNKNTKINKNRSQNEIIQSKYTMITPSKTKHFKLDPLTKNHSMLLKISTEEESNLITRNKTLTISKNKIRQSNTLNPNINLSKNNKIKQMLIRHSSPNNNIATTTNKVISNNIIIDFDKIINNERKFLKKINENSLLLEKHLNLFKLHLELSNVLINELCINEYPSFRNIPEDINDKLLKKLTIYFNTLRMIFFDLGGKQEELSNCHLFNYNKLNCIYKKLLKTQMVLYTSIYLLLLQTNQENVYVNLNNHCLQIMKELSNSILVFFANFIYEELIIYNYTNCNSNSNRNSIGKGFKYNFIYRYSQAIKEYKKNPFTKNSIALLTIKKNVSKCIQSIKCYNILILKYLLCSQFSKAIEEVSMKMENNCSPKELCSLLINSFLFSLIEFNNNTQAIVSLENQNQIRKEDINTSLPYLPPIKAYYALTLVVDLDETLIHFFQSKTRGIYLVRPYCFEFLDQLSDLYEIIVFTAGTKEYADKILNLIDKNNKYFKHRLYRDHVSSNNSFQLK